MKISVKGVVYDASNLLDAPINLLTELHRTTGLEGQDVMDGVDELVDRLVANKLPDHGSLLALTALVWLGKRIAGEQVGFEEAVNGLAVPDIAFVPEPEPQAPAVEAATTPSVSESPDPTQPGSDPGTVAVPVPVAEQVTAVPVPVVVSSSPSPGVISPTP